MEKGLILITLSMASCESPKVKYSGFNDLVVGSQRIVLYENSRFYLEIGLGGTEGNYTIKGDTIIFEYDKKPSNSWPSKMLMRENKFITISFSDQDKNKVRIDRYK